MKSFSIKNNKIFLFISTHRSLVAWILIVLFYSVLFFKEKNWKERDLFAWDAGGYYYYSPAVIYHGDISLRFLDHDSTHKYENRYWAAKLENGNRLNRYTVGTSIMQSPFFTSVLASDLISGNEVDEYSQKYEIAICLSALFYSLSGLWLLRKILLNYFDETVTAISIFCIATGTNLLYYTLSEPGMSHMYSFFLFALFVLLSIKWHEEKKTRTSILIGIVLGMIFLVRPTNIVIVLFFIFYGVYNLSDLKNKFRLFFKTHLLQLSLMVLSSILILSIQLFYWKYITGSFYYHTYGDEKFYFSNPHILEGLLSYRKGWLVYTPLMFLAFIGFVFLRKQKKLFIPVLCFLVMNLYIVFSWWSWWYAGSFGQRALIESLVIMSIPLACLIKYIFTDIKKWIISLVFFCSLIFISWMNYFQTWQYKAGHIHFDSMTKEAYWAVFLNKIIPENLQGLMKEPDNESALKGKEEYSDK